MYQQRLAGAASGRVTEIRRQPALGGFKVHAFALGVILNLVAVDLADGEVAGFGMREIKPADRRRWPHGEMLGDLYAGAPFDIQNLPDAGFFGVLGTGGIAGRGADTFVLLLDQGIVVELLIRRITPELL